jgi:hypothetical protein
LRRQSKKVGRRDEDATVVTIDQTRKAVGLTSTGRGIQLARGRQSNTTGDTGYRYTTER